jgi:hypothetical protein
VGFLFKESIARIARPLKRFLDHVLAYFRFNKHIFSLIQGQGAFSGFGNARN